MKVKIPHDMKTLTHRTEVFDVKRTQLYPNDNGVEVTEVIPKGSMVACNLYCAGIWLAGGKFGVIWNLSQAMVKPSDSLKKGECYIPAVDEDGNPIEETDEKAEEVKPAKSNVESDGEDEPAAESESTPEPEPEPVKEAPKKKAVKKGGKE
jgi:hypothetical protein